MANNTIKDLSMVTKIQIEGTDKFINVDFTDKRFVNRLLKLVKKYQNIENIIQEKVKELDTIEDELDKLIAYSDMETEILEGFKDDINKTFNADITTMLFGDCIPDIERYFPLFESIMPYVAAAKQQEMKLVDEVSKKYGINRLANSNVIPLQPNKEDVKATDISDFE